MNIREALTALLRLLPTRQRQQLKSIYKRMPGFGRNAYFAQYGEDAFLQEYFQQKEFLKSTSKVILSANLGKAVGQGFYVDVGANEPIRYSNTYWFYKHGWRGINIDAAPGSMKLFHRNRSRDINLEALISDEEAELTFYHWETPFLVNTLSPEHASYVARTSGRQPTKRILQSRRLDSILNEHLPPDQVISFMSVDVEGHDLQVLRSSNWQRFRPELVLVEDFKMAVGEPKMSPIYNFMRSIDYELYAWLRPTVIYRQVGSKDWQDLIVAGLDQSANHISEMY